MKKIGLIGTGIMGYPIAQNLLKAGYPLTVYTRRDNIRKELEAFGAAIAPTPAELAKTSDIVILLVNTSDDVTDLLYSTDGIVSGAAPRTIVADMTTTDPEFSKSIAKRLANDKIEYLDAPISGGV
jgi:3-hydroxyisobutyrate dehydrogenase